MNLDKLSTHLFTCPPTYTSVDILAQLYIYKFVQDVHILVQNINVLVQSVHPFDNVKLLYNFIRLSVGK